MTETSFPVTTIHGHDFKSAPLLQNAPAGLQDHHVDHVVEDAPEDDGQISCICGFLDDDGWTVACDLCNRWQHQLCYYPEFEDKALPDALQHYCVDCQPRSIDKEAARERQTSKRDDQASLVNGTKRQAPKSHKKKPKEPGYTNGWPLEKGRHDRNSASPRDQPPPAKRPKTSHRTSDSVTTASGKGHSRKRTATNVNHRRSLSRSPESSITLYSSEFLRAHWNDEWKRNEHNCYDHLRINDAISSWKQTPEDEFLEKYGIERTEVFKRWDARIDDMPGKPNLEVVETRDDRVHDRNNNFPVWRSILAADPIPSGGLIGEIKGHLGFQEDYQRDPYNRFSYLRHPEPFVFFHHRLPMYMDSRAEGNELRYVRRSCKPNARLQIFVNEEREERDYHICFTAIKPIEPGVEIAVHWDTAAGPQELLQQTNPDQVSQRDMQQLSSWVSTVLANLGPCACQAPDCLMTRFDRRRPELPDVEAEASSLKKPKRKRAAQHVSPLNTHLNSRSGSEARKVEGDDEHSDSRSASGSADRGSASRDITPNTHYSHNGSLSAVPELSERERKKLAKEEEMFRRQEEEQSGKQGKKKRHSGGSALSTPNATSSKQLGFGGSSSKYADAGTSKQTGLPSAKPGRKPKGSNAHTPTKTVTKIVKRPRPDYAHAEVQCDLDKEEAERRAQMSLPMRPFLSHTQRLLHRCALNNAKRRRSSAITVEQRKGDDKMDVDQPAVAMAPRSESNEPPEPTRASNTSADADMKDAGSERIVIPSYPNEKQIHHQKTYTVFDKPPKIPRDPPAPPWPSQAAHSTAKPNPAEATNNPHKPTDMHIKMPPPHTFSGSTSSTLSASTPTTTTTGSTITQSPAALSGGPPVFSPSVTAAVTPSPAKKKMSLSDYTKRSKAKETEASKAERESSPASVASAGAATTVSSTLLASSSSATVVEGGKAGEEDVKMEDAGDGGRA